METVSGLAEWRAKVERHLPNFGAVESRALSIRLPEAGLSLWGGLCGASAERCSSPVCTARQHVSRGLPKGRSTALGNSVQSTGGGPRVNGNKTARRCCLRWGLLYSCLLPLQHPRLAQLRGRTAPALPSEREGLQVEGRSRGCLYREGQLDPSAPGQAPALLSALGTSSHRPPPIPRLTPVAASPSAPPRTCRLRICASRRCPFLLPVPLSLFKGDRIWICLILSHNQTLQRMHLGLAVGLSWLYPALPFAGGFSPHHVGPSLPLLLVLPLNIP